MTVSLDVMYQGARQRVADLVGTLSAEQLRTPVPATPGWTVHELLAHLVGGAADLVCGRVDGAPGDEWTARHVAERRQPPVAELLAEWSRVGPQAEARLAGQNLRGPNLVSDIVCHEADLCEALGLPRPDREHWQPVFEAMMGFLWLQLRDSTELVICDDRGQEWRCGSGEPLTQLSADGYELLRSTFSRRSQRQIAGWDWTPAPAGQMIERFGFFGPRADDQPVPAA